MTRDELHKKAVDAFANKPFSEAIDAVLRIALEEAARVCDEAEKRDRQAAKEPNDAEELAAFQRGAFISRVNAAAIRALIPEEKHD